MYACILYLAKMQYMSSPDDQICNKSQQRFNSVKELRIDSTKSGKLSYSFSELTLHTCTMATPTPDKVSSVLKLRNQGPPRIKGCKKKNQPLLYSGILSESLHTNTLI